MSHDLLVQMAYWRAFSLSYPGTTKKREHLEIKFFPEISDIQSSRPKKIPIFWRVGRNISLRGWNFRTLGLPWFHAIYNSKSCWKFDEDLNFAAIGTEILWRVLKVSFQLKGHF